MRWPTAADCLIPLRADAIQQFSEISSCNLSHNISIISSLFRSTGSTCPALTVPSYPPSMQSRPAKTCSGWYSPLSSLPCPTLTLAPTRTAITWPMGQGYWGTTRWLGPGSSAPLGMQGADAREMNRWGGQEDHYGIFLFFVQGGIFLQNVFYNANVRVLFWKQSKILLFSLESIK